MTAESLTKRQREILERLEQGMPVKQIATDLGVSRNAVYQHVERLRRRGALPAQYTPSGQPPRALPEPELELGSPVPSPGFGSGVAGGGASAIAELRRAAGERGPEDAEYAVLAERAIAAGDVAALAYELGRMDAGGDDGLVKRMLEAALQRLGALPAER